MIGYKDQTYCISPCAARCSRRLTEKVKQEAIAWWGSEDAPIAVSDFKCVNYKGVLNETVQYDSSSE